MIREHRKAKKFAPLYTAFQSSYSKGNVPDATELINEMKANAACKLLASLKESESQEYNLFYEDIKVGLPRWNQ